MNPGETCRWHLQGRDYVTIVVEGKGLKVEFDDMATSRRASDAPVHNDTDTRYVNVLVELKDT